MELCGEMTLTMPARVLSARAPFWQHILPVRWPRSRSRDGSCEFAALMFPEEQAEEAQLQRELGAWGFIGGIASSPKQRAQHRTLCA